MAKIINKSNVTVGYVRIEENLPEHLLHLHQFLKKMYNKKSLTLKTKVMDMDYNIRSGPIRWQY